MKRKDRRTFIKNMVLGGTLVSTASFIPWGGGSPKGETSKRRQYLLSPGSGIRYPNLQRVAFPIGGIGAGMFCLEGTGAVSHLSVRHDPDLFNEPQMFAAIHLKNKENGTRVLEGPVPEWKRFGRRDTGMGSVGTTWGLPRFSEVSFRARFPFGHVELRDDGLPLKAEITGWSPFIPNEENECSLPVGALEYRLTNTGNTALDMVFSFHSENFLQLQHAQDYYIRSIENGFVLHQDTREDRKQAKASFAVQLHEPEVTVDHCWFRGNWFDPLSMAWNTVSKGEVKANPPVEKEAPGASLYLPLTLAPGEERTLKVCLTWYVPESSIRHGNKVITETSVDSKGYGLDPQADFSQETYKPYYAQRFPDIQKLLDYWKVNYSKLFEETTRYTDAFYNSSLPLEVLDAIGSNLSILKSPTVMRQHDGRFWAWEGSGDSWGSCPGSCTHVWNYAQAVPHLFPHLERSLRHTEFCENQDQTGHQVFRANLPISPTEHSFHAAADGQLGGIMKLYREWRISGDKDWISKIFPLAEKSMDYCIQTWDPQRKGYLEEPHHNTYDIEFWGANGMCTSFYLGALLAFSKMGKFLGEDVSEYDQLYEKGKAYMETTLFNGEYFIQKIKWTGLQAKDPTQIQTLDGGQYSDEAKALLAKEGPKYQYGQGCLSDGILGVWIARMCGLGDIIDPDKIKSHLLAIYKYNFKQDLSLHANTQRPSYAFGKEGGLLLCTWPKGEKLSLPFVYSDEVWTGIEYQVASHLILIGEVEKGLEIVRTCRQRYDGSIRNPFNEYECGHWYARAMASYGLLYALTGLRYDAVDKILYVDSPATNDFTSFISTATGYGTVFCKNGKIDLKVVQGSIPVKEIIIARKT